MGAAEIAQALGGAQRVPGGFLARCPVPSHGRGKGDRSPSLMISDGERAPVWRCFAGCDGRDIFLELLSRGLIGDDEDHQQRRADLDRKEEEERQRRILLACTIWKEAVPAPGTPAEAYLLHRGISLLPPSIRYHASLFHRESARRHPALVAAVQGPDRSIRAVQRIFLRPDGSDKAEVEKPKQALGPIRGGAVRLAPAAETLVIAEGVESALSLQQMTGHPCWAALGATNIPNFQPPPEVRRLILAPDPDEAGEAQIAKTALRLEAAGIEVHHLPAPAGTDWNDLLPFFEERAAIYEHEAGESRKEAERRAFSELMRGAAE